MEKYRSKTTPEVADGNHGDLGRSQEGRNCPEGEDILLNMVEILTFLVYRYNRTIFFTREVQSQNFKSL